MRSVYSAVHGAFNIETTNVVTTPATLFVGTRNGDVATLSAADISQHLLVVAAAKLTGCETIPIIAECGSCFPIPDICCEQEASDAAGNKSSAIASPAATSLEYGAMLVK